jgi:hypothetical protein
MLEEVNRQALEVAARSTVESKKITQILRKTGIFRPCRAAPRRKRIRVIAVTSRRPGRSYSGRRQTKLAVRERWTADAFKF